MRPEEYLEAEWKRIRGYIPDPKDKDLLDGYVHFKARQYIDGYERWSSAIYVGICAVVAGLVVLGIAYLIVISRQANLEAPLRAELQVKEEQMRRVSEKCIDKIICDCKDPKAHENSD